jgi:uncharacterized protein (UPF0264 family)
MTRLLVSVRSAAEAEVALAGGAEVIDVKEPRRGSLGAAEPSVWREVAAVVRQRAQLSVALGELLDDGVCDLAAEASGFPFAKVGLAGCHIERGWLAKWRAVVRRLPQGVAAVPVAYADWPAARAPSPSVALALAEFSPARLMLIDTYDKSAGALLAQWSLESVKELAGEAAERGIGLALAGSLNVAMIEQLLPLAPAYIGVRGAACVGGRDGPIEFARVKSLARLIDGEREDAAA